MLMGTERIFNVGFLQSFAVTTKGDYSGRWSVFSSAPLILLVEGRPDFFLPGAMHKGMHNNLIVESMAQPC